MMTLLFDPEYHRSNAQDRGIRAVEEYELQRAFREADERVRAERKAARKLSIRRYRRPFVRHASPTHP